MLQWVGFSRVFLTRDKKKKKRNVLIERVSALAGLMKSNGGGRGADVIFGTLSACYQKYNATMQ